MKEIQPTIETNATQTGGIAPFTLHSVGSDQTSYKGNQKHFVFSLTSRTPDCFSHPRLMFQFIPAFGTCIGSALTRGDAREQSYSIMQIQHLA